MNSRGYKIIEKQVAKGDYHMIRLFCLWISSILGVFTYIETKDKFLEDIISEIKENFLRNYLTSFIISIIFLIFWFILIKKSKNLNDEIRENCKISFILGIVFLIILRIPESAANDPRYEYLKEMVAYMDLLGILSFVSGIIGLIFTKNNKKRH